MAPVMGMKDGFSQGEIRKKASNIYKENRDIILVLMFKKIHKGNDHKRQEKVFSLQY
jgi:hypothetical protein